jgi:hypothetical protein
MTGVQDEATARFRYAVILSMRFLRKYVFLRKRKGGGGQIICSHFGCEVSAAVWGGVAATGMRNSYGSGPKDGSTAQQYVQYCSASQRISVACDDGNRMVLPSSGGPQSYVRNR